MVSATDISGETCEEVPGIGSGWLLVDGIGNLVELDVLLCVGFDLFSVLCFFNLLSFSSCNGQNHLYLNKIYTKFNPFMPNKSSP